MSGRSNLLEIKGFCFVVLVVHLKVINDIIIGATAFVNPAKATKLRSKNVKEPVCLLAERGKFKICNSKLYQYNSL